MADVRRHAAAARGGGRALAEGTPLHQLEAGPHGGDSALLLRRFADVSDEEFEYVKAGAIFGVHFEHAKAAALAGVPARIADRRARAARPRGRARGPRRRLGGVRAPAVRSGAARGQPSALRARQHAAAFTLVVAEHGPDALAAEHAALAGLVGDPLAVEVTARAGQAALAQGALAAAATHLENAVAARRRRPAGRARAAARPGASSPRPRSSRRERCARELLVARARGRDALAACACSRASRCSRAGPRAGTAALHGGGASVATDAQAAVEVLCDALLTCLASAPAQWVLETATRALASSSRARHSSACCASSRATPRSSALRGERRTRRPRR